MDEEGGGSRHLAVPPVERPATLMHNGFEINRFASDAVDEGVGKAGKVQPPIVTEDESPLPGRCNHSCQRHLELI